MTIIWYHSVIIFFGSCEVNQSYNNKFLDKYSGTWKSLNVLINKTNICLLSSSTKIELLLNNLIIHIF